MNPLWCCLQPRRLSVVCCLFSLLAGCGPAAPVQLSVFPVQGSVTYNGKPVSGATVSFYKTDAPVPASGMTNEKGEFTLSTYAENDGAVVGKHQVTVSLPAPTPNGQSKSEPPKAITDLESPEYQAAMQKLQKSADTPQVESSGIPLKYASIQSTDLTAEVRNTASNKIDLILRD